MLEDIALQRRAKLLMLTDRLGPIYGSESTALFLHALVRMQAPRAVVELGTGLGISAFWMGMSLHELGRGHLWTVDNGGSGSSTPATLHTLTRAIGQCLSRDVPDGLDELTYLEMVAADLNLSDYITLRRLDIQLTDKEFPSAVLPSQVPVDLLFSDFNHGLDDIVSLLAQWLPKMSLSSSIFIDSAPTAWPSYLLLERLTEMLNRGRVPLELQRRCEVDLSAIIRNRRFLLLNVTENKKRSQNSFAWLKIEAEDIFPHPRVMMRGMRS